MSNQILLIDDLIRSRSDVIDIIQKAIVECQKQLSFYHQYDGAIDRRHADYSEWHIEQLQTLLDVSNGNKRLEPNELMYIWFDHYCRQAFIKIVVPNPQHREQICQQMRKVYLEAANGLRE